MDHHQIGNVSVTRIAEREPYAEGFFSFFPDMPKEALAANAHWLAPHHFDPASQSLLLHFHSWLVRTAHHTILVDTCNGNHKPRPGYAMSDQLNTPFLENLKAAGVAPEEIDFVMCTHLHGDHVGWNTMLRNNEWVPTFPNATYLMSKLEHDTWAERSKDPARPQRNRATYQDSILPVVERGMARMVEGVHAVDDCFSIHPAPGHTPGTCRADLASGGRHASFCGDILHSPLQVEYWGVNSRACEDQPMAAQSRREVLAVCAERHGLLMPMHFGPPFVSYIKSTADGGFAVDMNI